MENARPTSSKPAFDLCQPLCAREFSGAAGLAMGTLRNLRPGVCSASAPADKQPGTVTEQQGDAGNLGNDRPFVCVCTLQNASGKG